MRTHTHRAASRIERAWLRCVTPVQCAARPARQAAHGSVTYHEECRCGWVRTVEGNGRAANKTDWREKDPAAVSLGRKGGQVTSEAKAASARENGKKGGRLPAALAGGHMLADERIARATTAAARASAFKGDRATKRAKP